MKPFLKWAGNKYSIIDQIKAILPPGKRLIEPFAGAGAVFLNTDYSNYLLADTNSDLINLYQILKTEGESFINYCLGFFQAHNNSADVFYQLRELFNTTCNQREKAALFIYLNRHCFNGLCRYNSQEKFNTPFGKYAKPYFPEKEMHFFKNKAQGADFQTADFIQTLSQAGPGDIIYCDPPYSPLSTTAKFTSYSAKAFTTEQQITLANLAEQLATTGITVIISNHLTDFTKKIYKKAELLTFAVQRTISCKGTMRNKVPEVLAIFN